MTVVETEEFLRKSRPLISDSDRAALVAFVGANYHNERLPVFLLSAYAKNRKANLSQAERNAMRRLVTTLVTGYPRKA